MDTAPTPANSTSTARPRRWRLVDRVPFVQDATTGKRVTPGWLAYVLVFGVLIIGVQSAAYLVLDQAAHQSVGSAGAQLQQALTFGAAGVVLVVWVVLFERREVHTLGFRAPGRGVLTMLGGFVAGVVLLSIPALFLWAIGAYTVAAPPAGAVSGWSAAGLLGVLAVSFFVQGGAEELLTRGFLLQNSGIKLPAWVAIAVPALAFTLIHGVATKPLPFAMIFLYALFASFVVLRTGSLWLMIGIHAGWNFTMGNLYGIPVSGLDPLSTSAIFLAPTPGAPDWLTGGSFGTEASVPAVLLLAILAGATFVVFRNWVAQQPQRLGEPAPEAV
jgi:Predicted metal-dependent membrane protease